MTELQLDFDEAGNFLSRVEDAQPGTDSAQPGTDGGHPELAELVERFASLPTGPGSIIVISLPNSIRTLRFFFAALLAGHTPALIAPSTPSYRVREVVRHLGAYALVRARIRPGAYGEDARVRLGGADLAVFTHQPHKRYEPGHVILMTSGTSGFASGCLHSLDALLRNASRHVASIGQHGADTVLVNLPVYYSFALVAQVLGSMVAGSRLVVAGPPFSVTGYAATIASRGVTVSSLTPVLAKAVAATSDELPAPLRTLTVGGQALDPGYVARLLKLNPAIGLFLTYGLTEAGPRVSTLAAHQEPPHRYGSVGRPLGGVEVTFRDIGRGGDQEVLVRSDTVYRQRVGEHVASKRGTLLEADLVATGDVGFTDAAGYLTIRGRSSDFTVIHGEKVCLASLRRAAESLPSVVRASAQVIADDGDAAGLELEIYVDDGSPLREVAVREQLRSMLVPSERPRRLRIHRLPVGELHK